MKVIRVRTADNYFQHIEVLKRNRRKRHEYGRFFVEGVRAINQLIDNNWQIYGWIYSDGQRLSSWAMDIIASVPCEVQLVLSPELMARISDKEDSSELLALAVQPEDDVDKRIISSANPLIIVCDRPASPGNLGTIIRSCDSFRVDGLVVTGHSADVYDPATIRASVGSVFAMPTVRVPSYRTLLPWFDQLRVKHPDLQLVGTTARTERDIGECDLARPTVLFIGNETTGLSTNLKDLCDELVRIPIHGSASSLNVGCAASICLYEADRQRRLIDRSR